LEACTRALTLHTLDTHPYNSGTKKWFHVFHSSSGKKSDRVSPIRKSRYNIKQASLPNR